MKIKLFSKRNCTATLHMNPPDMVTQRLGANSSGKLQMFHTQNVLRRIVKYMPFTTGATIKLTQIQTDIRKPEIVLDAPHGEYIFRGKVMVDPATGAAGFMTPEGWRSRRGCVKVLTNRDLKYNKSKNPKAGPRWDRAVSAAEGRAMAADLQRYNDQRR